MEIFKNHTLLGGTYLSQWRIQTFRAGEGGGGGEGAHPDPEMREAGLKHFFVLKGGLPLYLADIYGSTPGI